VKAAEPALGDAVKPKKDARDLGGSEKAARRLKRNDGGRGRAGWYSGLACSLVPVWVKYQSIARGEAPGNWGPVRSQCRHDLNVVPRRLEAGLGGGKARWGRLKAVEDGKSATISMSGFTAY